MIITFSKTTLLILFIGKIIVLLSNVVKITIFFEKRYLKYNDAYASIRVSKDKHKNQQIKRL